MLAAQGVTADSSRSRSLTRRRIRQADLIITATGLQRSHVVLYSETAAGRTFTLKELARVARSKPGMTTLDELIQRAAEEAALAVDVDPADDLDDPHGADQEAYDRMRVEVDEALAVLIPILRDPVRETA